MKSKKITFLINNLRGGGAEGVCVNIANGLVARGWQVDLYVANNQIYFGELTFRPYGGFMKFVPESFDEELGSYLDLNIKV